MPESAALKGRIHEDMKNAMRSQDKPRLGAIRLILAAIKQQEVDSRAEVTDDRVIAILDKMAKQRRESLAQYQEAGRDDLAAQEQLELDVIGSYLPEALTEQELAQLIDVAIAETQSKSVKDMGKVMGKLKGQVQGRADMSIVSQQVKAKLAG